MLLQLPVLPVTPQQAAPVEPPPLHLIHQWLLQEEQGAPEEPEPSPMPEALSATTPI